MMSEHTDQANLAELLMRLVRDRAIEACDRLASGQMAGPHGNRWREFVASDDTRKAFEALIPDVVDATLFELLNSVDNEALPLAWRRRDGSFVALSELGLGELAGSLMGSGGWRQQYSKQRAFDPFSELRLELEDEGNSPRIQP
jgi:hypothetical protein